MFQKNSPDPARETPNRLAELWYDEPLRRASLGVSFFWVVTGFVGYWSTRWAQVTPTGVNDSGMRLVIFMAAAAIGLGAGFGFSALLSQQRTVLARVPVAGLGMTGTTMALAFLTPSGWGFPVTLGFLTFSAAVFFSSLCVWLKSREAAPIRGRLQGAMHLQHGAVAIIALVAIGIFEYGTQALGLPVARGLKLEIALVSVVCGLISASWIARQPGDFVRLVGGGLIRWIYRIELVHPERIPKEGGALLLPNHVTYLDAFFITAACSRPVRFVMDETFMASRLIRVFVSIFDTVAIRTSQPREAIRLTVDALKNGELVCLFPEGQLTRTGTLNELRRGCELIAKKSSYPLIPLWCDGGWGSIFSFESGKFFRKRPSRAPGSLILVAGQRITAERADLATIRQGMFMASAEAISKRFESADWKKRRPTGKMAEPLWAGGETARRWMWINGHQIGQISALPWRRTFSILAGDPLPTSLPGLLLAFPELFGAEAEIQTAVNGELSASWVGGDQLRQVLSSAQLSAEIVFYDFGQDALDPIYCAGVLHCPCLAVEGRVIAMSMANPGLPWSDSIPQRGHKLGTWGKLLPGWFLLPGGDGELRAHGPAAPLEGLALPKGCFLDAEGFLVRSPAEKAR